jgi:predicted  nucleic acid-binding Zn-ribbon protein
MCVEKKGTKMERRKKFDAQKHSIRITLVALTVVAGLALTGCCKRFARIEEKQIELQRLSETNAKQVARNLGRLEENQKKLHGAIADVQAGTKAAVMNIAAVKEEQSRLKDTLTNNGRQLAQSIAGIEQNQRGLKGGIEAVQSNVQKVANGTDALIQNMLQLLEALQNNNQNLADTMNLVGQKQLKIEERILTNIQAIAAAVNAVEQRQAQMQGQIGDVRSNTQGMRKDMIAILERLRAELSEISERVSSAETAEDEPSAPEPEEE